MYYKRLLLFFLSMLIIITVMVDVATVYNSQVGMIFILALPIVLSIALLALIVYMIIKRK